MRAPVQSALRSALEYYSDSGVDVFLEEQPVDRTVSTVHDFVPMPRSTHPEQGAHSAEPPSAEPAFLGASEAYKEAVNLAKASKDLDGLQKAIAGFEGIAIKKTATNMVFSDGNPKARIMLVGEAPGADEDRQGKPFVGVSGQLLDKILACIGLDRQAEDPENAIYISNILNWRPPGNRTPSPAEIEVSLPFIERHIQLVSPDILILCGGVAAKALLGAPQSISRLRKSWHDYELLTKGLGGKGEGKISAIATYHPSYLLRTPAQKKAVWADMLAVKSKLYTQES